MTEPARNNGITYRKLAGVLGMILFAGLSFWMGNITGRLRDVELLTTALNERTQGIATQVSALYDKMIVKDGYQRMVQ